MSFIFYTFVSTVLIMWLIYRWRCRAFFNFAQKVPSNRCNTLLGWGPLLRGKDILPYLYEYGKKYGKNCVLWSGPFSFFISTDPKILKEILTSKNCIDKPYIVYKGVTIKGGKGLITENEPAWSVHRKLMNKAFSNRNVISFIPIFLKETKIMIKQIKKSMKKRDNVDMLKLFRESTLKIASITTLKRDMEMSKFNPSTMSNHLHGILEYTAEICCNPFLDILWLRKLAEVSIYKSANVGVSIFHRFIKESLNILEKNSITDRNDLPKMNSALDYVLNGAYQNILEMDEIQGQILHLFTAAFETTSNTLFFVIIMLAMHPEYQERAYEEIINVITENDNTEITMKQLDQLVYLDMIINETMRLLPVIPLVSRKVSNKDLNLSNGLTLPVGQHIFIDIYRLHRSKDLWGPNANLFNPDNFLPANIASRHTYSFLPFTKGQRFCIGWRYAMLFAKISLAIVIKAYKFSTDFKYENLMLESHVTLRLVKEPKLQLEQRKLRE